MYIEVKGILPDDFLRRVSTMALYEERTATLVSSAIVGSPARCMNKTETTSSSMTVLAAETSAPEGVVVRRQGRTEIRRQR